MMKTAKTKSPKRKFNGEKLKDMRVMRGYFLEDVAKQIGCDVSAVCLWEQGQQPNPRNLKRLSEIFRMPTVGFFLPLIFLCLIASPAMAQVNSSDAVRAIVGEATGQGLSGMTAVGEVIRNRGSVRGFRGYRAMDHRNEPTWVWHMAERAWKRSAHTNLARGATLFDNIWAFGFPKSWDRTKVVCVAQIGDHWFFQEG